MAKEKEPRHVIVSWASECIEDNTTMTTLQTISREVERLYIKQTGKPIQITTILRNPKQEK